MDMENLVSMANRIGIFFESMPSGSEALEEIRDHIRKYWPPLLRRKLIEHVSSGDGAALHPLVQAVAVRYAGELMPQGSLSDKIPRSR